MDDVKMRKELITREIMAELDKPEPNVKLLKMLRTEMKTIVFGEISSNDMASIKAPSDEVPLNSLPLSKTNNTQPIIASETNSQINNPIITDEVVASKLTADKMDRPTQMITSGGTEANWDDGNSNIKESYSGLSLGLYAGSLMILAGIGGLAISGAGLTALPLLVLMTIVFYVGGIMMKKSRSLRMASYAFVGTGMAMVPLIGVLIHNITSWNPNLVWLLTSLISVPIYIFAANIMKSKVLSYFAILGFASSACSLTATVSASVAWCFIAVMIVGLVFDSLALFGQTRHFGVMRDSVEQAGKWLPIATLLASTLAIQAISQLEYFIMISFVVVQLIANLSRKTNIINESALRIVLLIWLVVLVNMIAPNMQSVGIALAIGTLVEVIYSMTKIMKDKHISLARDEVETTCLILAMVLFIISGCLIGIPLGSNAIWGGTMVALLLNTALAILAHKFLKSHKWYIILTIIWLFLPIAFINTVGLKELWVLPVCLVAYLAESIAIEALVWNIEYKQANILTAAGTIMFCIASCVTSGVIGYQNLGDNTVIITAIIMSISATSLPLGGYLRKLKYCKNCHLIVWP